MDFFQGGQGVPQGPSPKEKNKKVMILMGGAVAVIVIIMIIVAVVSAINNQKNNLIVDGANRAKLINSPILQIDTDGKPYIAVEKIASYVGYSYYNGKYKSGTEDTTQCYVKNENEIAMLEWDSDIIYKTLATDTNTYDYYKMEEKTKRINDRLYISLAMAEKIFNIKCAYNSEKNVLSISTLKGLVARYNTQIKNLGYKEIAPEFVNQKALIKGLIVVIKNNAGGGAKEYGVLNATGGSVVIGAKYNSMEYLEGTNEFLVKMGDKMGVLNVDASTKIGFNYSEVKLMDNKLNLYLVKNGNKYGVVNENETVIIPYDFEGIGINQPELFPNNNITNKYVLFDYLIPARYSQDKWSLYSIGGEVLRDKNLAGFGCVPSSISGQTGSNVLLIPGSEGLEGVVVFTKRSDNKSRYGIMDRVGKFVVPDSYERIYMTTSAGITEYFGIHSNQIYKVSDLLKPSIKDINNGGGVTIQ